MKPMYLGDGKFTPYQPWPEHRKRAASHRAHERLAKKRKAEADAALEAIATEGKEILEKMKLTNST